MAFGKKKKQELAVETGDVNSAVEATEESYDYEYPSDKKRKINPGVIIAIILFLVVVTALTLILGFNAFGIRDKYMHGFLERIPIVNNILPNVEADGVAGLTNDELIALNEALQEEVDGLRVQLEAVQAANREYQGISERAATLDTEQEELNRAREDFANLIAQSDPNPQAYAEYYGQISQENAERIYREVITRIEDEASFKRLISTYQNMDDTSAASILEQMVATDLDLVAMILDNISTQQRSDILAAMSAQSAASVTKRLTSEEWYE